MVASFKESQVGYPRAEIARARTWLKTAVLEKELKLSRQLRAYIVQLAAGDGLFEHRHDSRGVSSGHVGVYAFPFADAPEELFEREFLGILARPVEWLLELLGKLGGEIPFLGY